MRSTDMRPQLSSSPHATHRKEINLVMIRVRKAVITTAAALTACLTSTAFAASTPSTRLVSCGAESCLLVNGQRNSATSEVRINGHRVDVQGDRNWRVRLPVATVRDWSVPFARKLEVSTHDVVAGQSGSYHAILPIGLLGHVPDLASLVITLH